MYLNDLKSTEKSVEKLNSVLADTFGHDVNLGEMSTDALGRMLTATTQKMMTIKESDMAYWDNPHYNKLNLIQHQLRTYINEVAPARTDGKAMKKQKTLESKLMEDDLASAEVLLAAQELVDQLQKMIEDLAEMQVQDLMPIVDSMKTEVGFDVAEAYNADAETALSTLLDQAKAAKEQLENATLRAQGKAPNTPMASSPSNMDMDADMDMEADMDMGADDDFGGAPETAGPDNNIGRELKAESVIDRMEGKALKEARVLDAKRKVLEAAKAAGYSKKQLQQLLMSI